MGKYLHFNTDGINLYFLCPFVGFFFLVGSSFSAGFSVFGKFPYTQNIIVSLGEMLAIIPHLISEKIDKDTYQNNQAPPRDSIKREDSSNSKKLSIELVYNNREDDLLQISIYQILLLGFVDFLQSLCFFYGNNFNEYQLYAFSSHIFFLCLFTKLLIINKLYLHHIFSFVLFFIFDAIHILIVMIDKLINYNKIQLIFLLISNVCLSFELVFEKKIMEKTFITPYKLCFLVGLSSLVYNIIASIIVTIISSKIDGKCDYCFNYSDYFSEMFQRIGIEIIIILIFMILNGLFNIFQFITIKRLSPNHALITQIILAFYLSIVNILPGKDIEIITRIASIVIHSICILILLIFLEIIEIKICGLDQDTTHNIRDRSDIERYNEGDENTNDPNETDANIDLNETDPNIEEENKEGTETNKDEEEND